MASNETFHSRERKKMSNKQASAIMSLNQEQSPFLRLPAEIRNKIYALVFGGLIIESKYKAVSKSDPKVLVQVRATESNDSGLTLSGVLQLLNVCRQIHMETRFLPFSLNEFQIRTWQTKYFLHGLTKVQRSAISALRIDEFVVHHIDLSDEDRARWAFSFVWSLEERLCMDTFWRGLGSLRRMKGLKRVVIEKCCCSRLIPEGKRARKDIAISRIHKFAGRRDIEVVVEGRLME